MTKFGFNPTAPQNCSTIGAAKSLSSFNTPSFNPWQVVQVQVATAQDDADVFNIGVSLIEGFRCHNSHSHATARLNNLLRALHDEPCSILDVFLLDNEHVVNKLVHDGVCSGTQA